jgi:hypothetical protein
MNVSTGGSVGVVRLKLDYELKIWGGMARFSCY